MESDLDPGQNKNCLAETYSKPGNKFNIFEKAWSARFLKSGCNDLISEPSLFQKMMVMQRFNKNFKNFFQNNNEVSRSMVGT